MASQTSAQEPPRPSSSGSSSALPNPSAPSLPTTHPTPTPRQQSSPAFNLAGLNLPGGINGLSDQARLALVQQMQAGQQANGSPAPGGMTMANATALLGGSSGGNNDAIMRQLQALQASQARMSQHRALAEQIMQSSTNGARPPMSAPSPVNGVSTSTPPQFNAGSPATTSATTPALNGAASGPSPVAAQISQQQERLRQSTQTPSASTPPQPSSAIPATPSQSTNPTAPTSARPVRPPVNPQNQSRQFAQSLANYFKTTTGSLPPDVFNGVRDGAVQIAGKWFNLLDFFAHFAKHQVSMAMRMKPDAQHWQALIAAQGLPVMLPEPTSLPASLNTNGTIPPVRHTSHYIVGLYLAYVKGFEEHMQRQQQRQRAIQQGQTPAPPTPVNAPRPPPSASGSTAPTPTTGASAAGGDLTEARSATTPAGSLSTPQGAPPAQPAPGPSTSALVPTGASNSAQPTSASGPAGGASMPSPASQNASASSSQTTIPNRPPPLKINKRTGSAVPTPIDTSRTSSGAGTTEVTAATPSSARKRKLGDGSATNHELPQRAASPKRARYKVEYNPLHIPMTHSSGWDERAVRSTFAKNNLAHPTHSIHELEVVDMEAVLMGLRSRLPRELSYALATLSMLSMPHPEDNLDGLPLMHLPEIFHELLDLAEESAFGEDGYEAWEEKMREREETAEIDIADLSFEDFEKLGRHWDVALPDDIAGKDKWRQERTGGTTDVLISTLNLIRNFSIFEDNRALMGNESRLFITLSRIIDTRLVRLPGRCTTEQSLSIAEHGTVCRDSLMILLNVGLHVKLASVPFECATAIFRLVSRTISSYFDISLFKDSPYGWSPDAMTVTIPVLLSQHRAVEAFYAISGSDANREVLARIPEDELVEMYSRLIRLLPVTRRAIESLLTIDTYLVSVETISLAIYSLAFLSPLPARARMRAVPGSTEILRRLILATLPPTPQRRMTYKQNPHGGLCRRVAEILGVLNGTVMCGGEVVGANMSFAAGAGDGLGWRWDSGRVVPGWMAKDTERLLECLMVPLIDPTTFGELDGLWWGGES